MRVVCTTNSFMQAESPAPPTSLEQLAIRLGEPTEGAGNRPVLLNDPDVVWFVESGSVDVFLPESSDGRLSDFKHMVRAEAGSLLFGVESANTDASLVVLIKGLPGSKLRRLSRDALWAAGAGDSVVEQLDSWVARFAAAVARDIDPRPAADVLLEPGGDVDAAPGRVLAARERVVWVADRTGAFLGTEEPAEDGPGLIPVTPESWLVTGEFMTGEKSRAVGLSSQELAEAGLLFGSLAEFHRMALDAEKLNRRLLLADAANQQTAGAARRRLDRLGAERSLFGLLTRRGHRGTADGSVLMSTLESVGAHEGIAFRRPIRAGGGDEPDLNEVLTASGVRARRIRLTAGDRWWVGDSGGMLGYRRADGGPVALLPGRRGNYRMVDPVTGSTDRLTASNAALVEETAYLFYRPLPDDRPVRARDVLRLAGKGQAFDVVRFVVAGLLSGALVLVPAVVIGALADRVFPTGDGSALVVFAAGLVVLAAVLCGVLILQGTALMRLEGRSAARVVAALWDRLLGLPARFLRRFPAGELETRMMVFQTLRDEVSGIAANALLSMIFLLPTFILLFFYNVTLGWLSLSVGLLALAVTFFLGILQFGPQRERYMAARRLTGDLFQFVNGIGKLRLGGAENSAFAAWARGYRKQKQAEININRLSEHLTAFSAAVPAIAATCLFGVALIQDPTILRAGDFIAIFAASMMFYMAIVRLGVSFEAIAAILPGWEQAQPILAEVPEVVPRQGALLRLDGELRFDNVGFGYVENALPILNGVSIHIRPGEFVAIVGESGSGKSTLIRLALGLEETQTGAIYYDKRDLANLNLRALRRQIGVVTQDVVLQPGSILENIIGMGDDLNIDDAWRAARLAAVDDDIAAMPMGMFTPVGDSAANFSGGQVQRIRIAAALVRNPRIVVLDEATNWLDTRSQGRIMQSIEGLSATRLVIAHRLSTIRKADRIYVLHAGEVIQQGGFDELFESEGAFRNLALRQIA